LIQLRIRDQKVDRARVTGSPETVASNFFLHSVPLILKEQPKRAGVELTQALAYAITHISLIVDVVLVLHRPSECHAGGRLDVVGL
jgi:hypothetical protein